MDLLIYSSLTMVNSSKALYEGEKTKNLLVCCVCFYSIVSLFLVCLVCIFLLLKALSISSRCVMQLQVIFAWTYGHHLHLLFVHPFKSTLLTIHLNTPPPIFLVIAIMESSIHITFISKKLNLILSMLVLGVWQVVAITTLWID